MVMDPTLPRISVRDLMMQAFLTGWELSDKTVSQDEYLQSSIQVIEMLQVEPENLYAEEGLGLPDGEEVDHLDISIVPAVVGETNLFCVSCCIIRPQILIVAPAKIKLTVRGTRVVARISHCCESP